jgi:hypothetical protein
LLYSWRGGGYSKCFRGVQGYLGGYGYQGLPGGCANGLTGTWSVQTDSFVLGHYLYIYWRNFTYTSGCLTAVGAQYGDVFDLCVPCPSTTTTSTTTTTTVCPPPDYSPAGLDGDTGPNMTLTLQGVIIPAGYTPVLGIVYEYISGISIQSITMTGFTFAEAITTGILPGPVSSIWYAPKIAVDAIDDIIITFNGTGGVGWRKLASLWVVGGLVASPLTAFGSNQSATGTTSPTSLASGSPATASNFVYGLIGTLGPAVDNDGTWSNSFVDGQHVGTNLGDDRDIKLCDGEKTIYGITAQTAAKTGIVARPWAAVVAMFTAICDTGTTTPGGGTTPPGDTPP